MAPNSPEQLATAITKVLCDSDLREKMGAKGKAFVESNFAIQAVVDKVIAVYEKLVVID